MSKNSVISWAFISSACGAIFTLGTVAAAAGTTPFIAASMVTNQQVIDFIKEADPSFGGNAKLVYMNGTITDGGEIHFIDFSEGTGQPLVHKIAAITGGTVPVISPDGQWVVYGTGQGAEGHLSASDASVYICKLEENAAPVLVAAKGHEPRFKQNAEKPTVIYGTVGGQLAWELPDPGKTMQVEIDVSGGTPVVGQPSVLWEYASMMGGLSYDGRYLCSAGMRGAMVDLTGGKTKPDTVCSRMPLRPKNGEYPGGVQATDVLSPAAAEANKSALQTCNPSISSSRSGYLNAMMYLTTGSGGNVNDVINGGMAWAQWQMVFISDFEGRLLWDMRVPLDDPVVPYAQGMSTDFINEDIAFDASSTCWHHPEWSNHPYFAATAIILRRGWGFDVSDNFLDTKLQERIYLLDLKNKRYKGLLRAADEEIRYKPIPAADLNYPWLWVEVSPGFSEEDGFLPVKNEGGGFYGGFRGNAGPLAAIGGGTREVTLFAPDGRVVRRIPAGAGGRPLLSENLNTGVYCVKASGAGSAGAAMKLVTVR
jgi:hypothetical protein